MTAHNAGRLLDWLRDVFTYESPDRAADAMADATRWGWLPALSGVAAGAHQARASHHGGLEPENSRGLA
ncbi:hypothetical protein ACU18_14300 [Arthrobacter sp. ZBG10]|uniref:hypothetical protein n=1 Tax=Arthrobacter sp. ZBG10 TaxID=1676590 RepID=UPI000682699F|nr:hypothetical protein [Arthrobacter sp. ZBG10]KNH16183.1 hypothetical protein ACU18_14300 [Arthrobacter sp. ZBG10]